MFSRAKMKHNLNPVMNAQLDRNRRIRTHRRNLSDPRFSTSLTDSLGDTEVSAIYLINHYYLPSNYIIDEKDSSRQEES